MSDAAPGDALAAGRARKAREAAAQAGLDALVLLKSSNVRYAAGVVAPHTEGSREAMQPTIATVPVKGEPVVLASPDGRSCGWPDGEPGAGELAARVREALPGARRLGIDRWSVPLLESLRRALPEVEWVDADAVLGPARQVKLPGEVARLREAQERNERAVSRVLEQLRPGVREIDLTLAFHEGLAGEGIAATHVESVWCAAPRARVEAPWTPPGAFPYRELTSERVLGRDDDVIMDTGILHEGYMSDFGRTWPADPERPPSDGGRAVFEEWCAVRDRLLAACRPGRTALDLRRAALEGWARPEPPWPVPLYVAHSIGLGGVEPPFVGTELGEAVEAQWELRPGMVLVFEPYVWVENGGAYRAEETVVVTDDGCERFTHFPYGPWPGWAA